MFCPHCYLTIYISLPSKHLSVNSQQLWKDIFICHNRQQFPNIENFTKCCLLAPSAATAGGRDGAAPRTIVC